MKVIVAMWFVWTTVQFTFSNVFRLTQTANDLFIPILQLNTCKISISNFQSLGSGRVYVNGPYDRWDGRSMESGAPVPDGVYYFICTVNTIRLSGTNPLSLLEFFIFSTTREQQAETNMFTES